MYNYDNELQDKQASNSAFSDYYMRLKALACTMFKWEGLPDTVNEQFLENTLFLTGRAVFFNSDTFGYMALKASLEGKNFYDLPQNVRPLTPIKSFDAIPYEECVLIRNTIDMFPTFITTYRYAKMLYDIDQTIDVNIKAQKTPILIQTTFSQKRTAEAVYQKYNGNTPVIYGSNEFDPNSFRVLKTDAPFVSSQLQDIKTARYNEYLSFLGIGIADEKRERRVENEVNQFDRQANALANIGLMARSEAAERINKLFGLNVSVHLSTDSVGVNPRFSDNATTLNYVMSAGPQM